MRFLKAIMATMLVAFVNCGGGSDPTANPQKPGAKHYGTFRNLVPKNVQSVKEGSLTTTSITMSPREHHRSILMMNGKVLIVGGDMDIYNPTMDIYNPETETFTQCLAKPRVSRRNKYGTGNNYEAFGMCNLPDGKVVIFGFSDYRPGGGDYKTGDIYDPVADTLTPIKFGFGSSIDDVYYLGNNKALAFPSLWTTPIVIDIVTGDWDFSDITPGRRTFPNNATLQDTTGKIWAFGGLAATDIYTNPWVPTSRSTISIFDPTTSTWTVKADLNIKRHNCSAVLLPGNKIGIYGGDSIELVNPSDIANPNAPTKLTHLTSVEIYDINTNTVSLSTELLGVRSKTEAIYLQTGYVLIAGGVDASDTAMDSELIHNQVLTISGSTGNMLTPRVGHYLNNLPNGLILVTGGSGSAGSTAEIFDTKTKLYIKYSSEQVVVGNTLQLNAVDDTGNPVSVTWSTVNNEYGTIDNSGLLTSIAPGTVEITASGNDLTAVIRITIIPE